MVTGVEPFGYVQLGVYAIMQLLALYGLGVAVLPRIKSRKRK